VALTDAQRAVLAALAPNRSPDSVFAGGATLNRDGPRRSRDLDIEHPTPAALERAWADDCAALRREGFEVTSVRKPTPGGGFAEAVVRSDAGTTLLDWTYDTPVRFFPAQTDPVFGWRLHDFDLAVNKILALAGRREPRDYVDLVMIHRSRFPIATVAWAASGKDAGMTPGLVLDEITRNAAFTAEQITASVDMEGALDLKSLKRDFLDGVAAARDLFATLPLDHAGLLYVDAAGHPCLPDPAGVASGHLILREAQPGGG
jgi:hypothetical protein